MVRRDFATLSQAQVDALKQGITVMQGRPQTDVTSWLYQANIHGVPSGSADLWSTCQHGSYFFFSWHRMYLYYFERILRAASGDASLTLPYWNYTDAGTATPLPLAFRQPADASNALFVAARNPQVNNGALLPWSILDPGPALAFVNFSSPQGSGQSFGGQEVPGPVHLTGPHGRLESQPHDVVHGAVGGWMGNVNLAARDPIFWLHHCNIDRQWERWLAMGGGRQNPPDTSAWATQVFEFFDETGTKVQLTGQEIVDTAQQLGYVYDALGPALPLLAEPPPVPRTAPRAMVALGVEPQVVLGAEPVTTTLDMPAAGAALVDAAAAGEKPLVLHVGQISFDEQPALYYEIYLNLPPGGRPDPEGPHFVGNLPFFGLGGEHGGMAEVAHAYDITGLVRQLREAGAWSDDPRVTFARGRLEPAPGAEAGLVEEPPAVAVRIGRIAIMTEE
jgi:tyrosinase